MQTVSATFLQALKGSYIPTLRVDAWYGGELVLADVPVVSGSVTVDRTRTIQGSMSLVAASSDGSLVPSSYGSPLAPYGSVLNVRSGIKAGPVAGESVSLGWYRIDSSDPAEWWKPYRPDGDLTRAPKMVCRGTQVTVQGSDRMAMLDDARFLVPEAPASLTSTLDEIKRLARTLVPVADLSAIADAAIPASVAYQTSRTQALQDLADVVDCWVRMDPNGALTLRSQTPSDTPVWTIEIGDQGTIIDWGRKLDRSNIYNGVISTGNTSDGVPVQGMALERVGPLGWDGPFGRVPFAHSSPLLTTNAAAQADAETRLARLVQERVVPISVTATANPALEIDDTVKLVLPDKTLTGQISSVAWPLPATSMTLVVMVPRAQVWGL